MTAEPEAPKREDGPPSAVVDRSHVPYLPPGAKVPPCPFPCSICRAKGRQ
ncbi:hypothetical protein GCM10009753_65400 [Streptantibioticus ferralitis]